MIDASQVTIIIPHYGNSKEAEYSLDECLTSLRETAPDIKRIVAYNGNQCYSGHNSENFIKVNEQGQCKAVNAAVATTNTPWIFVTNDDMIYAPDWFKKLTFFDDRKLMCVSPQLVEPRPGAPTFEVFFAGGAGGDFDKEKWLQYVIDRRNGSNLIRTGFNLPFLIKRELWDTVGGYDINYDPWGSNSDSDLEYKIKLAGVQPYQNTNCVVYHFSQTSGTFEPKNDSFRFKNYGYFREKWGFDRTDDGIWEATFTIPTVEQGRVYQPDFEGKYK